jgi:hypothetical protein
MSKSEIYGLFRWKSGNYIPYGLNLWQKLWWRFMPGEVINVRWPTGNIVVDHNDPRWCDWGGAVWVDLGFSADPNDHYRPEMEKYCGRQGWNWNWGIADNDVAANRLTIKIRRKYANYAILLAIKWA